jgi:hypothetical protein
MNILKLINQSKYQVNNFASNLIVSKVKLEIIFIINKEVVNLYSLISFLFQLLLVSNKVKLMSIMTQVEAARQDPIGSDIIRQYPTVGSDGIPIVGNPL